MIGWLSSGESIEISAIAWGEFLCGPLSPLAEVFARKLLPSAHPLERADAEKAAELFNLTGRKSKSYADCCIGAVAIRKQAALATSIGRVSIQPVLYSQVWHLLEIQKIATEQQGVVCHTDSGDFEVHRADVAKGGMKLVKKRRACAIERQ
jgi:predicted nucleic acid-binding protein